MSRIIKAGERIILSSGEYSDYSVLTTVDALEDFDIDFIRKEWVNFKASRTEYCDGHYEFLAWLINVRRCVAEVAVDWREWHIGSYSRVEFDENALRPWRDGMSFNEEEERYALMAMGDKDNG